MGIKFCSPTFSVWFSSPGCSTKDVAVQQRSVGKVPLHDFHFGDIYVVEMLASRSISDPADRLGGRPLPFCFNYTGDSIISWHFTCSSKKICKNMMTCRLRALDNCPAWFPPARVILLETGLNKPGPTAPVFRFPAAFFLKQSFSYLCLLVFQGTVIEFENEWNDFTCRTSAG